MVVEGITKCLESSNHDDDDNNNNNNDHLQNDISSDGMQCVDHPYRTNPGGICAFCLQEKLGKLVSSSFPLPLLRSSAAISSSSSAASPAARSDRAASASHHTATTTSSVRVKNDVPFLLSVVLPRQGRKSKKSKKVVVAASSSSPSSAEHAGAPAVVFKRSKSTATPRRGGRFVVDRGNEEFSPSPRVLKRGGGGFWSFLNLMSSSSSSKTASFSSVTSAGLAREKRSEVSSAAAAAVVFEEENDASFERKVSRSRSVGCGSRSFSGDFFERISTGFGDCTLRRVESQREGKVGKHRAREDHCMKERVRCGGIFGGFILTSSSSSSSDWDPAMNGPKYGPGSLVHGRTRSWSWAFASPIRAFTKPSGPTNNNNNSNNNNESVSPNLAAIPSLLAVRG